jgi:hypothetical protein
VTPLLRKCGILDVSQTYRPPQSVTGIAELFFLLLEVLYLFSHYHTGIGGFESLILELTRNALMLEKANDYGQNSNPNERYLKESMLIISVVLPH